MVDGEHLDVFVGTEVEEARVNKVKRVNRGERTVSGKQRDEVGAAVAPNMRERETPTQWCTHL